MAEAVRVLGLAELQRAFALADKAVKEDLRDAVAEAAQPVREEAQVLAGMTISHMKRGVDDPWARMRIGVTGDAIGYVAPVERGVKVKGRFARRRPNLGTLLKERMETSLEHNRSRVERRMEGLVDEVADVWERA